jgi:hypothetical protein
LDKSRRKKSKDSMISGLRDQINTYQGALQMLLGFISMQVDLLIKKLPLTHMQAVCSSKP